jgi:hypothetical protein
MRVLGLVGLLLVAGCYGPKPAAWMGAPAAELVSRWGAPDSMVDVGSGQVMTWVHRWRDSTGWHTCRQSFTVRGDVVTGWSYDDCDTGFGAWGVASSGSSR